MNQLPLSQKKIRGLKLLVARLFKNTKGEPYDLTDGQAHIFYAFINPLIKEVWISATTRYGKTEVAALALIYLAVFHKLKLPIVAGSAEKAKLIMEYVVQHIGDHEELYRGLINVNLSGSQADAVDKLKVQMSKEALRWSDGGWIFVTSVDSRNISKEGEGVVGEGGDVVTLEEAGLIKRKEQFSKIVRMTEGTKWGKLVMIGNCVENSVFEDAFNDPNYYKVRIDLDQAIREGRTTPERLERQKRQTTSKDWKRYYLVLFPDTNEFTVFKPKKYEILPENLEFFGAIDPSLGESKKADLVGIVVLGREPKTGQLYEVVSLGKVMDTDEALRFIFNLPYKFRRFGFEVVQFQKYYMKIAKEKSMALNKYIPFEGIEQKLKKEVRIESLEPYINTQQILFKGEGELWTEMQDYPESDHVDVLDALEMAKRLAEGSTRLTDTSRTTGRAQAQTRSLNEQQF